MLPKSPVRRQVFHLVPELQERAHSPWLDFDELSRVAAGLASESKNGTLPYSLDISQFMGTAGNLQFLKLGAGLAKSVFIW